MRDSNEEDREASEVARDFIGLKLGFRVLLVSRLIGLII